MIKVMLVDWCRENNNTLLKKEWNYEKNLDIEYNCVSSKSTQSVWWKCSVCGYEWKARIGNRTGKGSGCPACANKVVWKGHNDLETTHPELAKEWDYHKNGVAVPSDYVAGSRASMWWKCNIYKHEWKASISSRSSGSGCPICAGNSVVEGFNDLCSANHSLAEEWSYEDNYPLLPTQVTIHSGKKVWWKYQICEYKWEAEIKSRTSGAGCPACANKVVWKGHNDLETTNPELAKEWDYQRNGTAVPSDYVIGSHFYAWWKCNSCGHEWKAQIKARNNGSNCPKCAKQNAKLTFSKHITESKNTILVKFPELIAEWDYEKNSMSPECIAPFSNEKAWWKCSKCGYVWDAAVSSRTRGVGCPACANKVVWKGHNDLETTHPELAKEWDYQRNGTAVPSSYTVGSGVSVWWICKRCGNNWESPINNRKGKPCPKCNAKVGTSEPEQFIYYYVRKAFQETINRFKASWLKPFSEIDIYIPEINLAIEYDGQRWHTNKEKDLGKNRIILQHGSNIVRFREENCPQLNDGCYTISIKSGDDDSLVEGINSLFNFINSKYSKTISIPIDLEEDRLEVLSMYRRSIGEKSLFYSNNNIVDEWNYEKNGDLTPKDISCFSHTKVWWQCSKCGYEYESSISTRFHSKKGSCPCCSGHTVVKGINDFASKRQELLSEWDYEKNGDLLPTMVTAQSGKKVWWKCPICNRNWIASIHDRSANCNHKAK